MPSEEGFLGFLVSENMYVTHFEIDEDVKIYAIVSKERGSVVLLGDDFLLLCAHEVIYQIVCNHGQANLVCTIFYPCDIHRIAIYLCMTGVGIDKADSFVTSVIGILAIIEHLLKQRLVIKLVLQVETIQFGYIYIYYFHNHSI